MDTEQGERLMSCITLWVIIDPASRKILRPSVFANAHQLPLQASIVDGEIDDRPLPKADGDFQKSISVDIRYSHIDVNRHVNNSWYADFACDALGGEIMEDADKGIAVIHFQNEATLGETIEMQKAKAEGGGYLVSGTHPSGPCFEAYLNWGAF